MSRAKILIECSTCLHRGCGFGEEPCSGCVQHRRWEMADPPDDAPAPADAAHGGERAKAQPASGPLTSGGVYEGWLAPAAAPSPEEVCQACRVFVNDGEAAAASLPHSDWCPHRAPSPEEGPRTCQTCQYGTAPWNTEPCASCVTDGTYTSWRPGRSGGKP